MIALDTFQVYVGKLHTDVSDKQLYDYFSEASVGVRNARVVRDSLGVSRGYGFVQFLEDEQAYKAVSVLTSRVRPVKPLHGCVPMVRETYQRTRAEMERGVDHLTGRTIFVGNLNLSATEQALTREFSKFGPIRSARIVPNKGFGFVSFDEHIAALAALSEMQNVEVFHQRIHCSWGRDRDDPDFRVAAQGRTKREEDVDSALDMLPVSRVKSLNPPTALSNQDRLALLKQAADSFERTEPDTEAHQDSLETRNNARIVAGMRRRLGLA